MFCFIGHRYDACKKDILHQEILRIVLGTDTDEDIVSIDFLNALCRFDSSCLD